ncbi:MAG: FtsW/RodA/SpoVE family cell cycle protein [Anaerolineae bacterium]|nr:FtsW/RodA/SpoVE family cell cycle protein [Anaerolineae bacterium]
MFPDRTEVIGAVFTIWLIGVIIGEGLLIWRIPQRDKWLFPLGMILAGWGLLILTRLTPNLAIRQAIWLIVALCIMLMMIITPASIRLLIRWSGWIVGGAMILLVATFFVGVHPSLPIGAPTLWLSLNRLFIQPSELLKLALILIFAVQLSHYRWRNILIIWGGVIILFMFQRDFGVAVLFMGVLWQLAYLAGIHRRILLVSLIAMVILAILGYLFLPIIRLRVAIWLNPWVDVVGDSYQLVQSLSAFADGGLFGLGFGMGNPTQIPLAHSDFIFSAIAEEWGLLGIFVLMTLLALLIGRCLAIGARFSDPTYRFLAWGIGAMFITQNGMIMAGALRILPLTGMPFTFVSYGGSSLVVSMMMMGVLLRLSATSDDANTDIARQKIYQWAIWMGLGAIFAVAVYWALLWGG